ncbi:tellurium resistance TerZ family protein [bacterium]|nr:tellurium resistance TerZ family protein [bacterium]
MPINLVKGEKIKLEKDNGTKLTEICIGLNWGSIQKKGFFGTKTETVDLDSSVVLFDSKGFILDTVYYGSLKSRDGAIKHSGDDRSGDSGGDDGLDNEVITINLKQITENADKMFFILNSFKGQDFASIPFARLRLYEGTPKKVVNVFASYNIASDPKFSGSVSMVLGKIYKHNGEWKVEALGEPTRDRSLKETIETIKKNFL